MRVAICYATSSGGVFVAAMSLSRDACQLRGIRGVGIVAWLAENIAVWVGVVLYSVGTRFNSAK